QNRNPHAQPTGKQYQNKGFVSANIRRGKPGQFYDFKSWENGKPERRNKIQNRCTSQILASNLLLPPGELLWWRPLGIGRIGRFFKYGDSKGVCGRDLAANRERPQRSDGCFARKMGGSKRWACNQRGRH